MNKKLLIFLILLLLPFSSVMAFKQATLYKGQTKIVVKTKTEADNLFKRGFKLFSNKKVGFAVVTDYAPSLSVSITSVQNTINVTTMTTRDGHVLSMSDFGSKVFLTIEPGTKKEEIVMCTGISGLQFTGCTRGLAFYGTSTATVANNASSHQSGSSVILSNVHYVYQQFIDNDTNQTIGGNKTFTGTSTFNKIISNNSTITGLSTSTQTDVTSVVTLYQLQQATSTGGVNSSETVKGVSELATGQEAASSTLTGSTGARLALPTSLSTSTSGIARTIPVTGANGLIDPGFYQGNNNSFTGTNSFSATTTFNVFPTTPNSYPLSSTSIANKGYVDSVGANSFFIAQAAATSTASSSYNLTTERSTTNNSYTELKYYISAIGGTMRTTFALKAQSGTPAAYGKIYINGVAAGTERSNNTTSYIFYTEDVQVRPGDRISVYAYQTGGGYNVYVNNFQLSYNKILKTETVLGD